MVSAFRAQTPFPRVPINIVGLVNQHRITVVSPGVICLSYMLRRVYTWALRLQLNSLRYTRQRPHQYKVRVYVLLVQLYVPLSITACPCAFTTYLSWLWHRPVNKLSCLQHRSRHLWYHHPSVVRLSITCSLISTRLDLSQEARQVHQPSSCYD